jgi:hypothetical protein
MSYRPSEAKVDDEQWSIIKDVLLKLFPEYIMNRIEEYEANIFLVVGEWEKVSDKPILDTMRSFLEQAQEESEAFLFNTKLGRNIKILLDTRGKRDSLQQRRKIFATYRLYRYHNFAPLEIAIILGSKPQTIQRWIGEAFKEQCIQDIDCVFKTILEPNPL